MNTRHLVQIIIKSIGIYFLFLMGTGLLGLLNPIFINNSLPLIATQLINLIIPATFAYAFLIKSDSIAKWLVPNRDENISISKPDFIHLLVVSFGFISLIWGLANSFGFNFNKSESESGSGFSFGMNFEIGNLLLSILGCIILKNRDKLALFFTKKVDNS